MSTSIKKYIFFALFLAGTVCSYAIGQMLNLGIGIMEDYISIGANGGYLPNIYFKKKLDQNGFHYVLRQKENTDLFDEIIEDIKGIRQYVIKPDSNEIYFVVEPDEDAVNFSMKMESFAPLVHRIEDMGIIIKFFISSWSGESLIPGKPSFKNPKAEIESIVNESNP